MTTDRHGSEEKYENARRWEFCWLLVWEGDFLGIWMINSREDIISEIYIFQFITWWLLKSRLRFSCRSIDWAIHIFSSKSSLHHFLFVLLLLKLAWFLAAIHRNVLLPSPEKQQKSQTVNTQHAVSSQSFYSVFSGNIDTISMYVCERAIDQTNQKVMCVETRARWLFGSHIIWILRDLRHDTKSSEMATFLRKWSFLLDFLIFFCSVIERGGDLQIILINSSSRLPRALEFGD